MIHSVSPNLTWSSASLIDHYTASNNILPAALQASNGTIWLAWQTDRYAGLTGRNDIVYRTMTGGTWSPVHNFTSSGMNASPILVQLLNGTIIMFWTTNPTPATSCSPHCNLRYESFNTPTQTWSAPSQLTTGAFNDSLSSATVLRDGTLWVSWTRIITTCSSTCSTTKQLYYRTMSNNVWSSETQLTTDSANWNWGPSVVAGKDSIVRVVYSKTPVAQDNSQIYYKTYNGTWTSETQIVSSTTSDEHPSLIQDRNGTFWIFWARKVYYTSIDYHYVLFDKYSYDNGKTWSQEFQITNYANTVDTKMPSAIQANNAFSKSIWIFYSSNYIFNNFDMYAISSSAISPIHDVTISNISAASGSGSSWTITVTVRNLGDYSETASVTLLVSNTTSYTQGPVSQQVLIGSSTNFIFTFPTQPTQPANSGLYSASATVAPVPGETLADQGDNSLQVHNLFMYIQPVVPAGGGGRPGFRT